jgi:hypothetical protein
VSNALTLGSNDGSFIASELGTVVIGGLLSSTPLTPVVQTFLAHSLPSWQPLQATRWGALFSSENKGYACYTDASLVGAFIPR